jgi:hypothetical protein
MRHLSPPFLSRGSPVSHILEGSAEDGELSFPGLGEGGYHPIITGAVD